MRLHKPVLFFLLCAATLPLWAADRQPSITSAAELASVLHTNKVSEPYFSFQATITYPKTVFKIGSEPEPTTGIAVQDTTGAVLLHNFAGLSTNTLHAGDVVLVSGIAIPSENQQPYAICRQITRLGHTPLPHPNPVSFAQLLSGAYDCRCVCLSGTIEDVFHDEIDPRILFFSLQDGTNTLYVATRIRNLSAEATLRLRGTKILVTGICQPYPQPTRRHMGRMIMTQLDDIKILEPPPADPFSAPDISTLDDLHPAGLPHFLSTRLSGRVLAVTQAGVALLRTDRGRFARVKLADGPRPAVGQPIVAVGKPETDMYSINLSRAIWRVEPASGTSPESPVSVSAHEILTDKNGQQIYQARFNGKAIRLRGTLLSIPNSAYGAGFAYLRNGEHTVPVDVSAAADRLPDVAEGSEVELTGICLMSVENWRPNACFPRISGFSLVLRQPDDLIVLARPPWWTRTRILFVTAVLLLALCGFAVWTVSLKRLAERRGRELSKESFAHAESSLKVYERTRLAVELHDTISQYLTGASMEVRAAAFSPSEESRVQHLDIALKTIDMSRSELRNCIWDLRNRALEQADLGTAIRLTLAPHVGTARVAIRFNVPRERLSDNTAHNILCIIRELCLNGLRHGEATVLRIAGAIEGRQLLFSVGDNGCGFDAENAPGMERGHFGLQGIRERMKDMHGTVNIRSSAGKGTVVSLALPLGKDWEG